MGRLDRSSFAFFKEYDSGYCAYLGYLRLEAVYKNPTMKCFLQLLQDSQQKETPEMETTSKMVKKRARNRWILAYTLIRNPSLINLRVQHQEALLFTENRFDLRVKTDSHIIDIAI